MKQIDLPALPSPGSRSEPLNRPLSPALVYILGELQRELGYGTALAGGEPMRTSQGDLIAQLDKVAARLGFELGHHERDELLAHLEREQNPFGILQELIDTPAISDIIITNFCRICVQEGRRNYATGLSFPSPEAYEVFVEHLLQKAGTTYSNKKPIADGMIGNLVRIHAVHASLCESGPYVTIRVNRFSRVRLENLEGKGIAPRPILDYLRALIAGGQTLLIAGEVGTGKTTLARALAATIPQDESILVIEDTPEIMLEHPHVRYLTTREANSEGAGRVSPAQCIRAGMRMAMNRIIFGEMRDAEAAESFIDVCASGHPGLSTIHARSAAEAVSRLELFLGRAQRGASRNVYLEQIATAVQAIIHVDICKATGQRRIIELREIGPVADNVLRSREIFHYHLHQGLPAWRVVSKTSAHRDILESAEEPVSLAALPGNLNLSPDVLFEETKQRKMAA